MTAESTMHAIVTLNEASKEMQDHADHVRLRALDALVRSVRTALEAPPGSVNQLAGFREVSIQMRQWSDDLGRQLTALRTLCSEAVQLESRQRTRLRRARLLQQTCESTKNDACRERLAATDALMRSGRAEVRATLDRVVHALQELKQAGLMATVLARTAKIEAWSGDPSQREVLAQVADEFGEHAQQVLQLGKTLLPTTQRAREAA